MTGLHAQLCLDLPSRPSHVLWLKKQKPHLLRFILHWCSEFHFFLLRGRRRNLILLIISFCICIPPLPAPCLVPPHCTSMLKPLPSQKKKAILPHLPPTMSSSQPASLNCPLPPALSSLRVMATDIWLCCLWESNTFMLPFAWLVLSR